MIPYQKMADVEPIYYYIIVHLQYIKTLYQTHADTSLVLGLLQYFLPTTLNIGGDYTARQGNIKPVPCRYVLRPTTLHVGIEYYTVSLSIFICNDSTCKLIILPAFEPLRVI